MNWFVKLSDASGYLESIGVSPELIQWALSQPNSQYYINMLSKNPSLDIPTLQNMVPQSHRKRQTKQESNNDFEIGFVNRDFSNPHNIDDRWDRTDPTPFKKWALSQFRKNRVTSQVPGQFGMADSRTHIEYPRRFTDNLGLIYDWWRYSEVTPEIASYNFEQAMQMQEVWHRAQAGNGEGLMYGPEDENTVVFSSPTYPGWTIKRVVSKNDLNTEGNMMDNCVGGSCRAVESGGLEVYSLRDPQNIPHVTIGIERQHEGTIFDSITEINGHSNQDPKPEYKAIVKEWFEELKKTIPDLWLGNEEAFNFDDLQYEDSMNIDDKIHEIVFERGNGYGLEPPLAELDIESLYSSVISALSGNGSSYGRNYHDTRNVHHIGLAIAEVAWKADKARAQKYKLLDQYGRPNPHYDINGKKRFESESKRYGVKWLWAEIEDHDQEFNETSMDYYVPYADRDNYESDEEFEAAEQEEYTEYERQARGESLPSALDDVIATALVELAKEDPFLEEHYNVPTANSKKNWLQKASGKA